MKLMAMRIEPVGGKDLHDILNLMQVVGFEAKAEIVDFAAAFYPEARISGKLRLAIDHLWQAYHSWPTQDHEPPRYFGRSGPKGEG